MSTPTLSMLVASTNVEGVLVVRGYLEAVQHVSDLSLSPPGSQLLYEFGVTCCLLASLREQGETVVDVILHQHERAAQFAQRVEVRNQRPVRIARAVVRSAVGRRLKKRCRYSLEGEFRRPSGRSDPCIPATGRIAIHDGEGRVIRVNAGRWELRGLPVEQRCHLFGCAPNCCCGADDFRAHSTLREHTVDRSLIEARDGAKRTGNQMQLVLQDQIGRLAALSRPKRVLTCLRRTICAYLSIVPMSRVGRIRYTSSSTVQTGRGTSGSNRRHSSFSHRT